MGLGAERAEYLTFVVPVASACCIAAKRAAAVYAGVEYRGLSTRDAINGE